MLIRARGKPLLSSKLQNHAAFDLEPTNAEHAPLKRRKEHPCVLDLSAQLTVHLCTALTTPCPYCLISLRPGIHPAGGDGDRPFTAIDHADGVSRGHGETGAQRLIAETGNLVSFLERPHPLILL